MNPTERQPDISIRSCRSHVDLSLCVDLQTALRDRLTELFSGGYAITHFRREPESGVYILERYED